MSGIFGGSTGATSSGSGGGSSSSQLEQYIQDRHNYALQYIQGLILMHKHPYEDLNAFNPDKFIESIFSALATYSQMLMIFDTSGIQMTDYVTQLQTEYNALNAYVPATSWPTLLTSVLATLPDTGMSDTEVEEAIGAIGDLTKREIDLKVVPQFEAGMRDINAVNSSAFIIGEALLYEGVAKQVAGAAGTYKLEASRVALERVKIASDAVNKITEATLARIAAMANYNGELLKVVTLGLTMRQGLMAAIIDSIRSVVNIKKAETDENNRIDIADNRWYLDKWQYMGNMLASVRGAVHSTSEGSNSYSVGSGDSSFGSILSGAGGILGGIASFIK